jgi:starch-binding outer membrane protein, SusD/RagB family
MRVEMMMNHTTYQSVPRAAGGFPRTLAAVITALVILAAAGCDGLLDVPTPGVIEVDAWDDPANATLMVNAAIGDFECMLPGYIRSTATLSHELIVSGILGVWQNWGARREILRNDTGACVTAAGGAGMVGIYNPLQDARFLADDGYERISGFTPEQVSDREGKLAALAAYGGYTYTLMGEGMCESAIDGGPLVSRDDLMEIAVTRFTAAIGHAQAVGDESLLNMARVGRARAHLNLGNSAGALADATQVPAGFVRHATYSTASPRRYNTLVVATHENDHWSVHPDYRDLRVNGVPDPRVVVTDQGRLGVDNLTPQWTPEKYTARDTPIPIARWEEAQLIIAEVEGGQAAVDAINRLRTSAGLPLFESNDPEEIQAQVIEERRRELFLEGHRLNDMIRFGLPFPEGTTHKDQPYGSVTCVPLPDAERVNNPNIN